MDQENHKGRRQIVGFAVAGGLGFIVDAFVLSLLMAAGVAPAFARIPSVFGAIVTTWLINRRWTFRTSEPPSLREFVHYTMAMGIGVGVNYVTFLATLALSETVRETPLIGLAIATGTAMFVNFLTARFLLDR